MWVLKKHWSLWVFRCDGKHTCFEKLLPTSRWFLREMRVKNLVHVLSVWNFVFFEKLQLVDFQHKVNKKETRRKAWSTRDVFLKQISPKPPTTHKKGTFWSKTTTTSRNLPHKPKKWDHSSDYSYIPFFTKRQREGLSFLFYPTAITGSYFHCVEIPWKPKLIEMFQPANSWEYLQNQKTNGWKLKKGMEMEKERTSNTSFFRSWPFWWLLSDLFRGLGRSPFREFQKATWKKQCWGSIFALQGDATWRTQVRWLNPQEAGCSLRHFRKKKKHGGIIQSHETSSKIIKKSSNQYQIMLRNTRSRKAQWS